PVDQQQIDLIDPEPLEAGLRRALQGAIADVLPPHLGRQPDLIARNAACPQPFPDGRLVAVHLGRIDVPVPALECRRDAPGTLLILQWPSTVADDRYGSVADGDMRTGAHGGHPFWRCRGVP